ncbi:MAG TPA: c-type cytochrome [Rudaea sp.]|nr:c-type cytochrome [Rudaea sp.]
MNLLRAIILLLLLAVVGVGAFLYSGAFDVGADAPHSPIVYRLLQASLQRSIEVHAENVVVPPLSDPKMIAEGAEHYAAMCAGCHLAPGKEQTEIRRGLYPRPPRLAEGQPAPPAQAFWVVKHGIKLTAMPAWGTTHSDAEIWNIVALLQKLPGMSADDYQKLTGPADQGHEHHEQGAEGDQGHEHHEHGAEGDDQHDHANQDQHEDEHHEGSAERG